MKKCILIKDLQLFWLLLSFQVSLNDYDWSLMTSVKFSIPNLLKITAF